MNSLKLNNLNVFDCLLMCKKKYITFKYLNVFKINIINGVSNTKKL